MSTVLIPPAPIFHELGDQCIVLEGISPQDYREIEEAIGHRPIPHLIYWQGALELMSPSRQHELLAALLCKIVEICAHLTRQDLIDNRLTTLKRSDLQGAVEPDGSFYIQNAGRVATTIDLDLTQDPPPDLVVEVDLTSKSTRKITTEGLYSQLGIPEIWRCDVRSGFQSHFGILILQDATYVTAETSLSFPSLTADFVRQAILQFETKGQMAALKWFKKEFRKHLRRRCESTESML